MWSGINVSNISTLCNACSTDDRYAEIPNSFHSTILTVLFFVVGITTFLGNTLFIGYILYHHKKITVYDIFFVNISISDLFYVISYGWNIFPVVLPSIPKPIFPHNTFICRFLYSSFVLSYFVNSCLMAGSALSSYWKISNTGFKVTIRRAWIMVFIAYLVSILILILPTIGVWAPVTYFRGVGICHTDFSPRMPTDTIIVFFGIAFPLLFATTDIIAFCYYRIYRIVRSSSINVTKHHSSNPLGSDDDAQHRSKPYSKTDVTLAKTLLLVFGLFILSYAPYVLSNIFYFFGWFKLTLTQQLYLLVVSCTNSIFNPFIFYNRRSKSIQRLNIARTRRM